MHYGLNMERWKCGPLDTALLPPSNASNCVQIVLIGDHHQLPPVVKNQAFQRYSKLDQPLFTRFIRLGVPHTELSAQGRARPMIADLYNWRYRALGNLPHVITEVSSTLVRP
jgi:intron-binding protein aquarius